MEIVEASFPSAGSHWEWCFALAGVALLIILQPKEQRLRSIPLWLIALGLAYLILELHLPILQFAAVALALLVAGLAGLIWWLTHRLRQIAEQLYNVQQSYQQTQDKAAYLAGLEQCSKQLRSIKWFSNRATIRPSQGQTANSAEIKLSDYLEQQKQLIKAEMEKNN